MRSWKDTSGRTRLALGAAVVALLAIIGVLAIQLLPMGGAQEREPDSKRDVVTPSIKPLELGVVARISSRYSITVTEVRLYKSPRGPFVAASVKAKYTGPGEGEPSADLSVEFAGSGDSRNFPATTCPVDLDDVYDLEPLSTGKTGTFVACSTLSANRTKGGTVSVVDTAVPTEHRTYWSTSRSVAKTIPSKASESPTPAPSATQRPAGRPATGKSTSNAQCDDFDEEEFEEYKEWGEDLEEQAEKNRDAFDEDDLEEYEDWRDAYEKQLEFLEQLDEIC